MSSGRETVAEYLRRQRSGLAAVPSPAQLVENAAEASAYATAALGEVAMRPLKERQKAAEPLEYLTAKQVAQRLGLKPSAVYAAGKPGGWLAPAAVRVGKRSVRFNRAVLDRLLEERRGGSS